MLNLGHGMFADVSAATGLDLIDDSRAIALSDWDHDGDVDLWLANRTGPRLRLIRNESQGHFISIRLVGRNCNRDAIGARVELRIDNQTRVKTLYAGDGFLSQSSKWLHFGLGNQTKIDRITVRWPSDHVEHFDNVAPDKHYRIVQGAGNLQPWKRSTQVKLRPSTPSTPAPTEVARVRLSTPRQIDDLSYRTFAGTPSALPKRPVLVNLWATWCAPCMKELGEFAGQSHRLRTAGVTVLALNVDELTSDDPPKRNEIQSRLGKTGFAFATGLADRELIEKLEKMIRDTVYRHHRLSLPTSFLIDEGRLIAIYKGPVSVDQLLRDVETRHVKDTRRLSLPFAGRWAEQHFVTNPIAIARVYLDGGYPADARAHLLRYLAKNPGPPSRGNTREGQIRNLRLADVYHTLGLTHLAQDKRGDAGKMFSAAMQFNPRLRSAHIEMASLLMSTGDPVTAAKHLEFALRLDPADADAMTRFGLIRVQQGQTRAAIVIFRRALSIDPEWMAAMVALSDAHAQAGEFDDAIQMAERALAQSGKNDQELADQLKARLKKYRSQRPK